MMQNSFISELLDQHVHVFSLLGLWNEEHNPPVAIKPPMTDIEFHNFMDGVGHMIQPGEFRLSVFRGGVDPALRKVVWRHLLNIFPDDLSGKERFNYLQSKVREYYKLRDEWRAFFLKGDESEEIRMVANMVKKDVLRTDRNHKFYAGADDNKNILSLFNLLVTYAVTHPDVLYCQGMSDLASPILIVQEDEANAYICFCGLMKRLKSNFTVDGLAMTAKFQHLSLLLQHQDPDFYAYLKQHNAADMFFSYRWLLLELKREFPLDQALTMFEIMWSSLPPDPPEKELLLTDPQYQNAGILFSPTHQPNVASQAYFLLRSRMRKPPEANTDQAASTADAREVSVRANDIITPCEDISVDLKEFTEMEDVATVEILRSKAALIEKALEQAIDDDDDTEQFSGQSQVLNDSDLKAGNEVHDDEEILAESKENQSDRPEVCVTVTLESGREVNDITQCGSESSMEQASSVSAKRPSDIPLKALCDDVKPGSTKETVSPAQPKPSTADVSSCEEAMENLSIDYVRVNQKLSKLPSPSEFGHGNPFLMFCCLTLLVQQRDHIMANRMDYNDLAMHFDRMVRKHDVHKVVHQARTLYTNYLKSMQSTENTIASDTPSSDDVSV